LIAAQLTEPQKSIRLKGLLQIT